MIQFDQKCIENFQKNCHYYFHSSEWGRNGNFHSFFHLFYFDGIPNSRQSLSNERSWMCYGGLREK